MPDFFANAASHRPIVCFVPEGDIAGRIALLAAHGCGGLRLTPPEGNAIDERTLQTVDAACAAHSLQWWQSVQLPETSAALGARTLEAGAGGAAGAWQRVQEDHEYMAARAVPMGEKAPRWAESLDLLAPGAGTRLEQWNGAARLYLFFHAEQSSFWPGEADANDLLDILQDTAHALGKSSAWSGLWLDFGGLCDGEEAEAVAPSFPFSQSLMERFEASENRPLAEALPSLIADTGTAAVMDRLAFWKVAFASVESEFWRPIHAACDAAGVELIVGCVADKASAMEIRWGKMLRRYAHRVCVVPAHINDRDNSLSIRRGASRAALDNTQPPCIGSGLQGRALCSGATRTVVRNPLSEIPEVSTIAANLGALADWGQSGARTALLWPTRSFRAHYNPRAHRFVRWVEEDLLRTAHYLETLHFDFLLLPGGDLEHARVEEARLDDLDGGQPGRTFLRCGRAAHKFEMVVLPSVTTLARSAWDKLEAFVEAGGKVVCLGLLPRWSERGRDTELEARISRTTMLTIDDLYSAYSNFETGAEDDEVMSVGYPIARSNERGGRLSCYQPKLNPDEADARLRVRQLLMDSLTPTVQSQSEELLAMRRVRGEEELFLLHNQSDAPARIHVRLSARFQEASLLWSNGGAMRPVREWMSLSEVEGGGLSVPLEMEAGEIGALLRRSKAADDTETLHVERANFVVENVTELGATGYATESCIPAASWLEGERIVTRRGEETLVPLPLTLPWEFDADENHLTATLDVPADWAGCRIWFEAKEASPFWVFVNGRRAGFCAAPPWKCEITGFVSIGEECEIRLEGVDDEEMPARLAAYPPVEILQAAPLKAISGGTK